MSRADLEMPIGCTVLMLGGLALMGVAILALAVRSAIHDRDHCIHWEPYTYTQCVTHQIGKSSSFTTCTPVDSTRCTAWDDVLVAR